MPLASDTNDCREKRGEGKRGQARLQLGKHVAIVNGGIVSHARVSEHPA